MRVVQIEPGPCPTLTASAPQSARNSTPAALVTFPAMSGSFGNASRKTLHHVADALCVAVRGGDRDDIHAAFHQPAGVFEDPFFIKFAKRIACGRNRRAADEVKVCVARGLELRRALERDPFHVAQRDEPAQFVPVVHDQQLVDAKMLGEKFVGACNRILAQFLLQDGVDLRPRRQRRRNLHFCVTRLDDVAGQQTDELALPIHDGKSSEREFFLLDHGQHVADELLRRNLDRLLNQAVDVIFHAADFGELLPFRHVVMDEAEAAIERHRDGHPGFGHGVHVGRNDRDVQLKIFRERRVELRVAREDLGIQRRERDVIKCEPGLVVRRKKLVRRLVERIVKTGFARRCHVGKCPLTGGFGKKYFIQNADAPAH